MKRRNSLPQIAEQICELSLHAAFVDMMIPATAIEERDFEADVGFEKLGDFHKALSKPIFRILGSIVGLVFIGIDFFQLIHGFECFVAYTAHRLIDGLRIHCFESTFDRLLRAIHFKLLQIWNRDGGSGSL